MNGFSGSCNQYIKRPLNAYMIWTKEARRQIVAADPKLRMNEVSKAVRFFFKMQFCLVLEFG